MRLIRKGEEMEHNLKILLKHLKAVKVSPWAENYIEEMMEELRSKHHRFPILLSMRGENRMIKEILGE